MTHPQRWFLLIAMVIGFGLVGIVAQQQYSGGNAVTQSGTWSVRTQDGAGTALTSTGGALNTQIVNAALAVTQSGAWSVAQSGAWTASLNAGTNKVGIMYPYSSCGTTPVTVPMQALPTVSTGVTGSTSCLVNLYLHNSSSSTSYTATVTDGQGTPVAFLNAITINPGETREYNFPVGGPKFTTGLKWQASNAAVTGAVEMMQ